MFIINCSIMTLCVSNVSMGKVVIIFQNFLFDKILSLYLVIIITKSIAWIQNPLSKKVNIYFGHISYDFVLNMHLRWITRCYWYAAVVCLTCFISYFLCLFVDMFKNLCEFNEEKCIFIQLLKFWKNKKVTSLNTSNYICQS